MKSLDTIYQGVRLGETTADENEITVNGKELKLKPSLKLRNHSPTGFNWGYEGSGCAQLALAILYDFTGDKELSLQHYQDFKRAFIAPISKSIWHITGNQITHWLESQK